MVDFFIIYSRGQRAHAEVIAKQLVQRGIKVWWDSDLLPGNRLADAIDQVEKSAHAVVVLWSRDSINAEFAGAEDARRGIFPARATDSELPPRYRPFHTLDLTNWKLGASIETLVVALTNKIRPSENVHRHPEALNAALHEADAEAKHGHNAIVRKRRTRVSYQ